MTAVLESHDATTPKTFTLSQNYPNPFNPETTIRFDLPQSQEIELAIYNLAAQKVATLVQGHREAGSYSVRWDGVTDAGLELASGVYFYRVVSGEFAATRKMTLLK
ncbi:MAG: T9SS type A sorting domain-containing protein [Acidobacteria bacterium]|nr:T9SS type A sorting domain-containing protein [Acidobacteriota bacterium]